MNTQFKIDRGAFEATIKVLPLDGEDTVSGTGAYIPADVLEQINTLLGGSLDEVVAALKQEAEETRQRNWQVTVDAMEAARRGEFAGEFKTTEELMAWLHADDDANAQAS